MFKAKDAMTGNPTTVQESTDIKEAIRLLVDKKITGLPVVSPEGGLIGMVTEKDILQIVYKQTIRDKTVGDLMTRTIVAFDADDNLMDVYKCLMENNFRRVPILSNGKLVGIISRRDIIKFLLRKPTRSQTDDDGVQP